MSTDDPIADSLELCFTSDHSGRHENMVDAINRAARTLDTIAHAITPQDAAAYETPDGGRVDSLTEAVIFAAQSMTKIADAIVDLASAVRERTS